MIELGTWWLLLPLFFGLGWLAAKYDTRSGGAPGMGRRTELPDSYFRGLNFLLNEQPDKAIDAFVDVVRIDPETIELHFALGSLFRRRGETDRAIRVHQNLAERTDLRPEEREHAVYELGQDFLKAGLLDRAEQAFDRLAEGSYGARALRHRLDIAQMVRDWPQAIELASRLAGTDQRDKTTHRREMAHFHCEIAQAALEAKAPDFAAARREIDEAARAAPDHPRPLLLAGEAALAEGDAEAAIAAWRGVARGHPEYLPLVAEQWLGAHQAVKRLDAGIDALEAVYDEHPSVDGFTALASARAQRDGTASAREWAEGALRESPSLLGLERLLAMVEPQAQGEQRAGIELAQRLIQAQARRLSRFVCRSCGFKARRFYWHCPGCNGWDTYSPKRSEELERG